MLVIQRELKNYQLHTAAIWTLIHLIYLQRQLLRNSITNAALKQASLKYDIPI